MYEPVVDRAIFRKFVSVYEPVVDRFPFGVCTNLLCVLDKWEFSKVFFVWSVFEPVVDRVFRL